jgi:hypothetical protein
VTIVKVRAQGFFYLVLTVAAVIVVLKTLNWFPTIIQQDTIRRYDSIEEVRAKTKIRDLYIPSYFPQSIMWPPSEILAQTKPYPAVLMIFNAANKRDVALIISQAASEAFSEHAPIQFAQISRTVAYDLKGRKALLDVGACKNNEPCSRISWVEKDYTITLTMKSAPFELIRIAESMVH